MNEKIKSYTGVALIILLLVASYGIVQYARSYAGSVQSPRSFSVSGEGKVVTIPDIAQFSFGVITQGGNEIASIQNENSVKGNALIEFVKSQGVESKDIQTQGYNIDPRYQNAYCSGLREICPPPEIIGYTISQYISVKIRDFTKISNILSGVAEKGANSVSQLSFRVDDPTKLQDRAREKAMEKAKDQALAIAKAGGFRLGRLISVNQGGGYYPQPFYAAAEFKSVGAPVAPSIEPGSQEISANVTLVYEIK